MRAKIEQELARLEEGLPQMIGQRDHLNQQILRIDGAIATLRAMLAKEPVSQANTIDSLADAHAMTILQDAGILSEKA
jgi:hypothetical protein